MSIQLTPFQTTLGCIPVGYVYLIELKLTNISPTPEKIKIFCHKPKDEPNNLIYNYTSILLAPGMGKTIKLELHADHEKTSKYVLEVLSASGDKLKKTLTFFIVKSIQYKSIRNALSLVRKRCYHDCVRILRRVHSMESTFTNSTFSTALITDADLEEIQSMPLVNSVYWDSHTKRLCIDSELCEVSVDPTWTLENSIKETEAKRESRIAELEALGMVTYRSFVEKVPVTEQV